MRILAIDPGTTQSAWVLFDGHLIDKGQCPNEELVSRLLNCKSKDRIVMAYEMVACYGMAVGASIFETVLWTGRFIQAWGAESHEVFRREVKMYLCNTNKAKDSNVRQALLDRFEPTGGGKIPQIGVKANPGPLYGVSKDVWAALGIAITFYNGATKDR